MLNIPNIKCLEYLIFKKLSWTFNGGKKFFSNIQRRKEEESLCSRAPFEVDVNWGVDNFEDLL